MSESVQFLGNPLEFVSFPSSTSKWYRKPIYTYPLVFGAGVGLGSLGTYMAMRSPRRSKSPRRSPKSKSRSRMRRSK